jgi:hypothetical protein
MKTPLKICDQKKAGTPVVTEMMNEPEAAMAEDHPGRHD